MANENQTKEPMPVGVSFHESIASRWTDGYKGGSFERRRTCFNTILDRLVKNNERWLDLGCGSGILTLELLHRGTRVVAVDGSPSMLEAGRQLIGERYVDRLTWLQGDVEALPELDDESFDGIVCSSVIEYVDAPDQLLREAARLLAPGGRLIISVPPTKAFTRSFQKLLFKIPIIWFRDRFSYLAYSRFEIVPARMEVVFCNAGFSVGRITPFDPIIPLWLLRIFRPSLLIYEATKK